MAQDVIQDTAPPANGKTQQATSTWFLVDVSDNEENPTTSAPILRRPTVSVVIPTLNEAKNLPHVLPRIPTWVDEVVLVDGNSTDDTREVAHRLWPGIHVINETRRGKGIALRTGFDSATSDIIVMMDADGSMDPTEIYGFVGLLMGGAEFVKGSRFIQGGGTADMTLERKFGNWGFVVAVRLLFGCSFSDLCYGYIAFWRRFVPQLDLDSDGFEIETLMNIRAQRARLKIAEVPSFEYARKHGVSRLHTIRDGWRVLNTIIRERFKLTRRPAPSPSSSSPSL